MKFQNIIYAIALVLLANCAKNKESVRITEKNDYEAFLNVSQDSVLNQTNINLSFWKEKLEKEPTQYPYLSKIATIQTKLFTITGDINYLKEAEQNLVEANKKATTTSHLRALARNYISQHKFKNALTILEKAEQNGENLSYTQKMLFDVHLELGNYETAEKYLASIYKASDFGYLIRAAKWNDHIGDLQTAINLMEKALVIAESKKDTSLIIWSYTNLADFYGHNNQIEKSYKYYLKSLEIDPNNTYAKKGIAWIVYSHENNPEEALRILNVIKEQNASPDYSLFKAELAEYMNDLDKKEQHIQDFLSSVKNKHYGVMYHQHKAKVLLDELDNKEEALKIVEEEIENRATPQSYDLLAWVFYKNGNMKESLFIADKYVTGKSFEPEVLYHLAEIYKANKLHKKVVDIKNQLLESSYELGPVTYNKIQNL